MNAPANGHAQPVRKSVTAISPRPYADWEEAFAACRTIDAPLNVIVPLAPGVREVARIFPSGRCAHVRYERAVTAVGCAGTDASTGAAEGGAA